MNTKVPSPSSQSANRASPPNVTLTAHLIVGGSQTAGLPMTSPLTPVLPSHPGQAWLEKSLVA